MALLSYHASLQNITAQSLTDATSCFAFSLHISFIFHTLSVFNEFSVLHRLCITTLHCKHDCVCMDILVYPSVCVCVRERRSTTQVFISFRLCWQLPINVCAKIFASLIFHTLRPPPACLFCACVYARVCDCVCFVFIFNKSAQARRDARLQWIKLLKNSRKRKQQQNVNDIRRHRHCSCGPAPFLSTYLNSVRYFNLINI